MSKRRQPNRKFPPTTDTDDLWFAARVLCMSEWNKPRLAAEYTPAQIKRAHAIADLAELESPIEIAVEFTNICECVMQAENYNPPAAKEAA